MTFTFCGSLSTPAKTTRWGIIGLNLSVISGVIMLRLGYSLPLQHCLFQTLFGFPSPSCGMTRSLLALSQGNWPLALSYHAFMPVLVMVCGVAGLQSAIELITGRSLGIASHQPFTTVYHRWVQGRSLIILGGLFLAYYLLRLFVRYHSREIPTVDPVGIWEWFVFGAQAL